MAKPKSKAVAVVGNLAGKSITAGDRVFSVVRQVTLPQLKQVEGQIVHIRITSPIYVSKVVAKAGAKKADANSSDKPADLVNVVNLITGQACTYIVGAAVKGNLEEQYPDESYVGKSFAINKLPAPAGKRYKTYEILEIEDDGELA